MLVFHENAENIPARFLAMPPDVSARLIRVCNPIWGRRASRGHPLSGFAWGQLHGDGRQEITVVPGLRRFSRASGIALRRRYRQYRADFGRPDVVVYDSPYLERLTSAVDGAMQCYMASDPFAFYDWDTDVTAELEHGMLSTCDAAFAVSAALAEDFRQHTERPVFHHPNAVPTWLIEAVEACPEVPPDLAGVDRPIIGCVGKINGTYDWALLGRLAEAMPHALFVFVGPIMEPRGPGREPIERCFARPNVRWLGPRQRSALPAYLHAFDVCLNPLKVDARNDRRSPLRLYEYMASGKPIVSTYLREVDQFGAHVALIDKDAAPEQVLAEALDGSQAVDASARRHWLSNNTWEARAFEFMEAVQQVMDA